jgi:hypothetical protein
LTLIIALWNAPSIIYVIPFFNIKKVEVNTENPELKAVIEGCIRKDFKDNYLLLLLNGDKLKQKLALLSKYYVKEIQLTHYDWLTGTLKVNIKTRKPFFNLNDKFLLGSDGILFGFIKKQGLTKIVDYTADWNYGMLYDKFDPSKFYQFTVKHSISLIEVTPSRMELISTRAVLDVPLTTPSNIDINQLNRFLSEIERNLGDGHKIFLTLYGSKTYALKTY